MNESSFEIDLFISMSLAFSCEVLLCIVVFLISLL
jgi:hypothetical protein